MSQTATEQKKITRTQYADKIVERLESEKARMRDEFRQPGQIESTAIDNLLPEEWAREIFAAFPKPSEMMERKSLREHKLVAAQMDHYHPLKVRAGHAPRCCVSNYYFSEVPLEQQEYFHVTTFRGRPEEPIKDVLLQGDAALRSGIRKVFKKGVTKTTHVYEKDGETNGEQS